MSVSFRPFSPISSMSEPDRNLGRDLARHLRHTEHARDRQPNYIYEENHGNTELQVELPGVQKDHISIDVHDDALMITATRHLHASPRRAAHKHKVSFPHPLPDVPKDEVELMKERREREKHASEISYRLRFRIGNRADVDHVRASLPGDGILYVLVPGKPTKHSRVINIE